MRLALAATENKKNTRKELLPKTNRKISAEFENKASDVLCMKNLDFVSRK